MIIIENIYDRHEFEKHLSKCFKNFEKNYYMWIFISYPSKTQQNIVQAHKTQNPFCCIIKGASAARFKTLISTASMAGRQHSYTCLYVVKIITIILKKTRKIFHLLYSHSSYTSTCFPSFSCLSIICIIKISCASVLLAFISRIHQLIIIISIALFIIVSFFCNNFYISCLHDV